MNKKKVVKYTVGILLIGAVILAAMVGYNYYKHDKYLKHVEASNEEFIKNFPENINEYPDIKFEAESFDTPYDDKSVAVRGEDSFSLRMNIKMTWSECRHLMDSIDNIKKDGLSVFEKEIGRDEYHKLGIRQYTFGQIPSIASRVREFNSDNKITFMEYCSINNMLALFFGHREELRRASLMNDIKSRMSE